MYNAIYLSQTIFDILKFYVKNGVCKPKHNYEFYPYYFISIRFLVEGDLCWKKLYEILIIISTELIKKLNKN